MNSRSIAASDNAVKKMRAHPILLLFIVVTTYLFSIILGPYHTAGDQEHYNLAYSTIGNAPLIEAFEIYQTIIHTVEPANFFIAFFFEFRNREKPDHVSFKRTARCTFFHDIVKKGCNPILGTVLLYSNYYLMTMFFTLERKKFAFIFLLAFLN